MPAYTKPHLTLDEQVNLLSQRGLRIADTQAAEAALGSIGYYRLAAYLYTFRQVLPQPDHYGSARSDRFQAGYTFDHGLALWDFDRRLRSVVLQAMDLIEVAVRTRVAFETGRGGPFAYLDPEYVEPRSIIPKLRPEGDVLDGEDVVASDLELWAERVAHHETGSREEFAEHYRRKYAASSARMPVWVSVEVWDFGTLSRYYSRIMPFEARRAVSRTFGVEDVRMFTSWIHALNVVRNIAAHQSRLWNRKFAIQPKLPKTGVLTGFDHLAGDRNAVGTTIYPLLLIMVYLTGQLSPVSQWVASVRGVLDTFPDVPGHSMQDMMGFPLGWEQEAIWR